MHVNDQEVSLIVQSITGGASTVTGAARAASAPIVVNSISPSRMIRALPDLTASSTRGRAQLDADPTKRSLVHMCAPCTRGTMGTPRKAAGYYAPDSPASIANRRCLGIRPVRRPARAPCTAAR